MKKKIVAVLLAIIVLSMGLMGCGNSSETTKSDKVAKIGYLPITHAVPLYIEKEVEKGNIELVKFGSWPELMEALNSGNIDGASVLIELAMKAKAQGTDIKAVALGHSDGNALVSSTDINSVKDLKGKTVAIPNKLSTHNLLVYEALKQEGLTMNDINVVELAPSEMPVALQEKRIDAYCVAEPFGAKAVANGSAKVLKQSSDLIQNSICCSLVLRGEFIKDNNDAAKDVVKNYAKASEYITDNKDEAKEKVEDFLKVDNEVLDLSLNWISYDKLKIEEEDYNKILNYLNELKLLDNAPSYEEFVDNSLLDGVK